MYSDVDAWSAHLDKLGDKMFPQGYPWPVIVANLCDGGWKVEACRQIQRIGNRQIRTKAMSLFTQIEKVLIERPMMLDWPEDQKGWCQEPWDPPKTNRSSGSWRVGSRWTRTIL